MGNPPEPRNLLGWRASTCELGRQSPYRSMRALAANAAVETKASCAQKPERSCSRVCGSQKVYGATWANQYRANDVLTCCAQMGR